MIKALRDDLADASACLEDLVKRLSTMSREEQVDVAARIKAVAKSCEVIDTYVKDNIYKWRKGREGYVLGEIFKAFLKKVTTTRLDQKALKVEEPEIHTKFCKPSDSFPITFEAR